METEQYPMTLLCISHRMKNVHWHMGKRKHYSAQPWTWICERLSFKNQIWKSLLWLYTGKVSRILVKSEKDGSRNWEWHFVNSAEGYLNHSKRYIKRILRHSYFIPLQDPTGQEIHCKGLRLVLMAVTTLAVSLKSSLIFPNSSFAHQDSSSLSVQS